MSANKEPKENPVAKLRERFFEKKKNRSPSPEIKDTFRKEQEPAKKKDDSQDRAAKRPPEVDL